LYLAAVPRLPGIIIPSHDELSPTLLVSSNKTADHSPTHRYILDIGATRSPFLLQVAFAPCLLGYGAIARRIHSEAAAASPDTPKETLFAQNPYVKWIETYIGEDYAEAERVGSELLERGAVGFSRAGLEEAVEVFVGATKVSVMRWEIDKR